MSWPEASPRDAPGSWSGNSSPDVRSSWPDAPPQSIAGPAAWPEVSSKGMPSPGGPAVPDPVPAWAQPPTPSPDAWSNLSSPAPWPAERPAADGERAAQYGSPNVPADAPPPPQVHPADERTVTYGQHTENLLNERAVPSAPGDRVVHPASPGDRVVHPAPQQPGGGQPGGGQHGGNQHGGNQHGGNHQGGGQHGGGQPNGQQGGPPNGQQGGPPNGQQGPQHGGRGDGPPDESARPGHKLSRDPSDPENRFVTAGQISGSRTPPPERQQELWNTVFGDNYQAMGEHDALDDEDAGRPVWVFALGGSVAVALVVALLWAFLWGPLAGEDASSAGVAEKATATPTGPKSTKTSSSIGALPKYPGKASPVIGRVPDAAAGISMPRLGGTWQLDQRATVKATYGFDTRQYVQVAPERYATVMSGPLSARLASYYERDDLEPAIRQVVLNARKRFFPADNKVRKIAQQPIKVGDQTGRLIAYQLTSSTEKATLVTMAVNTGADVPAIVYMSIPSTSKQLLPDIRTVMNQIRLNTQS
ncbi:hypothetical protein GCM10009733_016830 [Nonomuraea maheshkhaliensis]|uniref:Uncharacterized protein n=2 Tax=Nonomuraea maheshkhaliensis TaxID=419590 RepID=A0ABN2EXL5_9ACTN